MNQNHVFRTSDAKTLKIKIFDFSGINFSILRVFCIENDFKIPENLSYF